MRGKVPLHVIQWISRIRGAYHVVDTRHGGMSWWTHTAPAPREWLSVCWYEPADAEVLQ